MRTSGEYAALLNGAGAPVRKGSRSYPVEFHRTGAFNGALHYGSEVGFSDMGPTKSSETPLLEISNFRLQRQRNLNDPEFAIQYGCPIYRE